MRLPLPARAFAIALGVAAFAAARPAAAQLAFAPSAPAGVRDRTPRGGSVHTAFTPRHRTLTATPGNR